MAKPKFYYDEKKYNYFYKITNEINGKFYYGIHSTDDLDDEYMGSGLKLRRDKEKYGIECFKKEILKFFDTRKELVDYEHEFITEDMIVNPKCYNVAVGGTGGFLDRQLVAVVDKDGNRVTVSPDDPRLSTGELVSIWKGKPKSKSTKKKLSKSVKAYFETEAGQHRREQISKERDIYWNSEEGQQMKTKMSEFRKEFYKTERGKWAIEQVRKAATGRPCSDEHRERQRKSITAFWNSERGQAVKEKYRQNAKKKYQKEIEISKYNVYEVLENGEEILVLDNTRLVDVVNFFGVTGINAYKYVGTGQLYHNRKDKEHHQYRIDRVVTKSLSKHLYYDGTGRDTPL